MAQSRESKFFLSGRVSPSLSEPNLQPNRCIPRILKRTKQEENRWKIFHLIIIIIIIIIFGLVHYQYKYFQSIHYKNMPSMLTEP